MTAYLNNGLGIPSIFDSFNARNLSPKQVAKSFVPSEHFNALIKPSHSVVVGPRGSGKTTLLKMLHCEALQAWKHPEAARYRATIQFTGVYVPADRVWKEKLDALMAPDFSEDHRQFFLKALFLSHVLYSLLESMRLKLNGPAEPAPDSPIFKELSPTTEVEFVRELASIWHLNPRTYSLRSLQIALSARKLEMATLINIERQRGPQGRGERLAAVSHLHLDLVQACAAGLEIYDTCFEQSQSRWAFLFDELELAPEEIVRQLTDSLRSVSERMILKLSLAPYDPRFHILRDIFSAMQGHDYEFITLWYANKEKGHPFAKSLINVMLEQRGLPGQRLEDIFGSTPFSTTAEDDSIKYAGKHDAQKYSELFQKMASQDRTVREFFAHKRIDPYNLSKLEGDERARLIRKNVPILKIREEFRRPDSTNSSREKRGLQKSRKAIPLVYSGMPALLDLLEGNPRWIKGVMGPLLDNYEQTGKRVSRSLQMREINKAINRFRALIRIIPCRYSHKAEAPQGVLKALDQIGEYFHKCTVVDAYRDEPSGSFIVDRDVTPAFQESLGAALNAGALVYVHGPTVDILLGSLEERRFRLSYLLAPYYKVPMILMKETTLKRTFDKFAPATSLFGEGNE